MADEAHIPCKLHWRQVRSPATLPALSETFAGRPSASILGGNPAKAEADGFSYWAAEPREIFEFTAAQTDRLSTAVRSEAKTNRSEVGWQPQGRKALGMARPGNESRPIIHGQPSPSPEDLRLPPGRLIGSSADDCFSRLQGVLNKYQLVDRAISPLPSGMYCGGWIGHFSYELGRYIERLPQRAVDDLDVPLIRLCFYDRVLAYDHRAEVFWLMALELPDDAETPAEKIATLAQYLDRARQVRLPQFSRGDIEDIEPTQIRRNMTQEDYLIAVNRIKDYIRNGDVYQVNFSHRFEQPFAGRPVALFHWQNRFNPSGYAAYLDAGAYGIVSASPEMFLTIRDGTIETKPIKGTRPRLDASDPRAAEFNERQFHDLLTNEKEQAELNMIIDLERNDVARICRPGTRRVIQPRTIETYPTVYHAVATIAGELRDGIPFGEVLKAMFPGGSITGAPKIRAMEIIDELEPTARSVYTGAIGYLGLDGTVCLNIAIRTVIITGGRAFVQTGGGIVADSDPQAEWDETITKARALLAGLKAVADA